MILDTCFIIDLLKNKTNALIKAHQLENSSEPVRTTTISVFELWQGLEDIQDEEKRERIEHFLSALGLLAFDVESAKIAGTIFSELERRGETIEAEDCMIAGIALYHREAILTRNTNHFQRIKGVAIEPY